MIDFHCHLDLMEDRTSTIQKLEAAQAYVLSVTTIPKAYPKTSRLVKKNSRIRTALGYHPQLVGERPNEMPLFERLLRETRYVGEVGLDGGKEFVGSKEAQAKVFAEILSLCRTERTKIISIHSRHAADAVLDKIEEHPGCGIPVLHWFTGSRAELERAIKLGCWFSVGAPMLRSAKGRAAVSLMPRERILTETDAPFASNDVLSSLSKATRGLSNVWRMDTAETKNTLKSNLARLVG
ncbi:Qat anti-phage system TatD family nuclease QatD [Celeribacter naphthalenivorans]|uniref:Qat anti-phage system TatD family nuclease QatD n=1 Tax=Celeribacter naphthalenivorans TaxID=1614694 RepID=UPI001CFB7A43|nr:Qat anti-phage system TatD family nuclease QatD [Celeribacter naphthalenivorans]